MDYFPIRLGTLRPGHTVNFNVHLKLSDRYIHYIRAQEPFEDDRLKKLKDKGVKKIFIPAEEEELYLVYLEQGLDELTDTNTDISQRGNVAHDSMVTEAEHIEKNLETEAGFNKAQNRVGKVIEFLASDKSALKSVMEASGTSQEIPQHGANVASLSLGLAMRLGGFGSKELFDLAMAALIHDTGKAELGLLPWIELEKITKEDMVKFKKHPQATVDRLAAKPFITSGILRLVLDHEELGEGQGYPERKNLAKLHISSQVLNLCNEFDRVSMAKKIPPTQLIRSFFQEKAHLFDLDHITQLGEVIAGN